MVKAYYVLFRKDNKPVCGCWKRAKDKDDAMLQAEFSLICKFPNVEYDSIEITNIED